MFHCSHCDAQYLKWQGRCSECGKWGTIAETTTQTATQKQIKEAPVAPILDLKNAKQKTTKHTPTNINELDRVLTGGIVAGSVTLIAGEPGIGKSTLIAQLAASFPGESPAFYVSGEESEGQVLMRFNRLNIEPKKISFTNTVNITSIISAAKKIKPRLLIIDSIQTMMMPDASSLAGTPTSVRACTAELITFAKSSNIPVILIGQMTKDGSVAGPKTLEHLVDTVLTLEGDKQSSYRMLRCGKNRFGSTEEVGVFEMNEKGMQTVENPSARFLEERSNTPGSAVTCIMEGTRPFLIEIQALVEKSYYTNPVRRTSGFDSSRLQMLLAIISKRAGVNISGHDVYVNIVGGMQTKNHSVDLAVCASIISSMLDKAIPKQIVVIGELGLGGEVRSVQMLNRRQKEAMRLGLDNFWSPKTIKHLSEIKKLLS